METKICNVCHDNKTLDKYTKKYKTKDGVQKYSAICKVCFNVQDSERRKTDDYKVKKITYDKDYYSENKEKIKDYKKEYHKENKEIILQKKKKYRAKPENRERAKLYIKDYMKNNREKYYEYRRKYPHIIA